MTKGHVDKREDIRFAEGHALFQGTGHEISIDQKIRKGQAQEKISRRLEKDGTPLLG